MRYGRVADHVVFVDGYLSVAEIAGILARTELFCTPLPRDGPGGERALAFPLAAGCGVVPTPIGMRLMDSAPGRGASVLRSPLVVIAKLSTRVCVDLVSIRESRRDLPLVIGGDTPIGPSGEKHRGADPCYRS